LCLRENARATLQRLGCAFLLHLLGMTFARLPTLKVHPAKTPSTTTFPQKIITTMADESKKRAAPAGGAEKSNKKSKVNLCISYSDRFQD